LCFYHTFVESTKAKALYKFPFQHQDTVLD